MLNNKITETFDKIPADRIINLAKDFQIKITNNKNLIEKKKPDDFVTQADYQIQELLLEYFENSALAGSYNIQAEETLEQKHLDLNKIKKDYLLIIDPLDGTNPFCRGEKLWGTMVGLFCKKNKALIYSWNLLSTGEIFTSESAKTKKIDLSQSNSNKSFDIFDYTGESEKLFPQKLEDLSLGKYKKHQIQVTSYPTAVWTGSELYKQRLNGLLWLPENARYSSKGKGHYPNYDLVFIGALREQGWCITLGKKDGLIQLLAIAENQQDLELIKQVGVSIMKEQHPVNIELVFENDFTE